MRHETKNDEYLNRFFLERRVWDDKPRRQRKSLQTTQDQSFHGIFLRCFLVFHPLFIMASRSDPVRKTKRNWNWFSFARHSHMFASTGRNVWSGLFKLIINTAHSPVGEVKWVKIASLVPCNFLCYFSLLLPFTHFSFARHAYFKRCRLCEYGIEAHENEKMTFRAPWELHWTCYDARLLLRFIFLYQSMTSW